LGGGGGEGRVVDFAQCGERMMCRTGDWYFSGCNWTQ
jgi:hypothetical protein